ncbi:MAG: hypothetical protein A2445_03320 [Candidatus Jacksonbacteria bacterium RIFOXYC2_FULL_44_29]|nr:MAG: hypothetical protein UW45_C0032G0006 [Parcubacteria group bacterium GW2011_GWC2_44_22]OGY75966.1 MAG: hypothetical protein A2240_05765 [Candidatus Jacksonbacteria bacterium RIFOXYA2_FULL_43_12]OGY77006.1 MAG: hypothetical protein A2295_05295 [Candidatus Jacksonbacteria bacterium RIFOXYB2_FULL_44_15]OGY78533.1 MAG: hypothetical protein A2550_02540 [Candidatus Jacksonbacteria bacterium RIFOXYD2_FULL_43_21]OGY79792.1 MAG: hypothetical protein A2445_03320 [Candidatus Jacksonbacteria bacteri
MKCERNNQGLTIIGLLVYIGLVAIVMTIFTTFLVRLVRLNFSNQAAKDVLSTSQRVLSIITQEILAATSVYAPTCRFDASFGQLSLETTKDAPTGENSTYVDFFVDGERLYLKREGQNQILLTAERVRVKDLVFKYLDSATPQTIWVSLTTVYDSPAPEIQTASELSLTTSVSLRSY